MQDYANWRIDILQMGWTVLTMFMLKYYLWPDFPYTHNKQLIPSLFKGNAFSRLFANIQQKSMWFSVYTSCSLLSQAVVGSHHALMFQPTN